MNKLIFFTTILLIIIATLIVWQLPTKVVLYNELTDERLELTNQRLIDTLIKPIDTIQQGDDRMKTRFSNTLTIYKGFIPFKKINFGMPSIFEEGNSGQILVKGKAYNIDRTFYDVIRKIEKEFGISFDTL